MKAAQCGRLSRVLAVACVIVGGLVFGSVAWAGPVVTVEGDGVFDVSAKNAAQETYTAIGLTMFKESDMTPNGVGWLPSLNDSFKFTARPASDYKFDGWSIDDGVLNTNNPLPFLWDPQISSIVAKFSLSSTSATAPTITTTSLPYGFVGLDYSATLAATGATPITWGVTPGNLPAGLSLNTSTGAISGKPTKAGTSNFTVTATNSGGSASKDLSITVSALTITTESLPGGTVGAAYSATLAATGATPITWSVTQGSLPNGLGLGDTTGIISGTPTLVGTSNFTVRATNDAGTNDRALSITVVQPKTATPTASPAGGEKTGPTSVMLSCTTPGAVIHYTTDGSEPTTGSPAYQGALQLSSDTTVKAIAIATGMSVSDVMTVTYTFEQKVATPYPSVAGGHYTAAQQVSLFCDTPGATIYYTTDGSEPTTSSAVYQNQAIAIATDTTLKAMAAKSGMTPSDVMTEAYEITTSQNFVPVQDITMELTFIKGEFKYSTYRIDSVITPPNASNQKINWDCDYEDVVFYDEIDGIIGSFCEYSYPPTSMIFKATIIDGIAPGEPFVKEFERNTDTEQCILNNSGVGTPMTLALILLSFIVTGLVKVPRTRRKTK